MKCLPTAVAAAALTLPAAAQAQDRATIEPATGPVEQVAPAPGRGDLGYDVPNYAPRDVTGPPVPDYPPVPDRSTGPRPPWMTNPAVRERFGVPPDADIKAYGVELEGSDVEHPR